MQTWSEVLVGCSKTIQSWEPKRPWVPTTLPRLHNPVYLPLTLTHPPTTFNNSSAHTVCQQRSTSILPPLPLPLLPYSLSLTLFLSSPFFVIRWPFQPPLHQEHKRDWTALFLCPLLRGGYVGGSKTDCCVLRAARARATGTASRNTQEHTSTWAHT